MKVENIRNVAILGHQSSGKTSLVESLAYVSKLIPTKGEIEKKNTLSDYTPEEQKRGSSIQTSLIPLNYEGFPKSVCTSINDAVCHGIPSKDEILMDGDIINVDVSTILDGYFADSSRMFMMGNVSDEDKKLVEVTKEAMYKGLEMVKPWTFMGDMGQAVNDHAIANGYSVVREIGGHGVGIEFHEEPWVSYVTKKGTEILLVPGMIFTIEPMINMGGPEIFVDEENDWTVYTDDGSKSAQWEIQVLVTEDGHEVLSW